MTPMTVTLPDDLAERLRPLADQLPLILEMGLREVAAEEVAGFSGSSDVLEFLVRLPSPQEVLALQPSPELEARVRDLLTKNRTDGLDEDEEREWDRYQYLEHLVRVAKANALLQSPPAGDAPAVG
jgi:hypothetical protein